MKMESVTNDTQVKDEEEFGGLYQDNDDFDLQEILYQSLQRNPQIETTRSYTSTNPTPNHGDRSRVEGNSSKSMSVALQLAADEALAQVAADEALAKELQEAETMIAALEQASDEAMAKELQEAENQLVGASVSQIAAETDEALAKELQEADNQLAGTSIGQVARTEAGTTSAESSPGNMSPTSATTSDEVAEEDEVDPDNMTYEELQTLGESIGAESKGLSDEQISLLPSTTYRTGFFSRKRKNEECVICYMTYKNRDKLITLPCQHQYHVTCGTRWLKINKACPVCNQDVVT